VHVVVHEPEDEGGDRQNPERGRLHQRL
jgi:hypothetical protein